MVIRRLKFLFLLFKLYNGAARERQWRAERDSNGKVTIWNLTKRIVLDE